MTHFRSFVLKLVTAFAVPWLVLIVWPALVQYPALAPVAFDKDKGDELDSAYSYPLSGVNSNGAAIYAQEGCVQCHTQVIRDPAIALDGWRKGWSANQEDARPAQPARATTLRDYLSEPHAFLGVARNGPDLANAGYRFSKDADVHMHLFAPQARNPWSSAPSYAHLYQTQKIQGNGSADALPLRGTKFAPARGFEVIPTAAANQLVAYIRSLKRDTPLPAALKPGGPALAETAPAK
jgi:cytochrome c oxidase cbb3-type subunit II